MSDRYHTRCGLPISGCALCSPDQFEAVLQEKYDMKRYPETLGDFYKACPVEYTKPAAIATARRMLDEYGADTAYQRAMQHRGNHPPGSWGRKHWDIALAWLEAQP